MSFSLAPSPPQYGVPANYRREPPLLSTVAKRAYVLERRSTPMFDDFSKRSKAVRAAFDLAEKRGWRDLTLLDIAQAAGVSLSDLRREFTSKNDIIRAFQQEVDAEVLAKTKGAPEAQSPRERLFDIVMTRFELMAPYKQALKRI